MHLNRRWVMTATALIVAAMASLVAAGAASAHIDLVEASPADGMSVDGPLEELRFSFTGAIDAVPDQTSLFDSAGDPLEIASIEVVEDGSVLAVRPAEPLDGDTYGAQWAARAGDAHPKTGTITFTVTAAASPEDESTDTPPEGGASGVDEGDSTTGDLDSEGASNDQDPALPATDGTPPAGGEVAAEAPSAELAAALAGGEPDTTGGERTAQIGRFFSYAGLLVAVGGLVYLAFVHHGTRLEGVRLVHIVRLAGVAVLVGTLLEAVGTVVMLDGGGVGTIASLGAWGSLFDSSTGTGLVLRGIGGCLVLAGARPVFSDPVDHPARADWWNDPGWSEPAAGLDSGDTMGAGVAVATRRTQDTMLRVRPTIVAVAGATALVLSGAFIGHTASTSPRWLMVVSDAAHVAAASVWVAGVAMLTATLWRRHQRGAALDAGILAARLSVAATASLAAVAVTGLALAWAIHPSLSALWNSDFGQVLLVKVGLVAMLAALGAYNHFRVVPELEDPDRHDAAAHHLRRTAAAEVAIFALVIAATAVLVGSSATV